MLVYNTNERKYIYLLIRIYIFKEYLFVNALPVVLLQSTGIGVPHERCREIHQYGRSLIPASKALVKDLRLHLGYIFMSTMLF